MINAFFFEKALKRRGVTGEALLQMLELRLDTIVHRLGFAPSRRAARQFVRHGHVRVNAHTANVPSMVLKAGDVVEIRDRAGSRDFAKPWMDQAESRGIAPWLALQKDAFRGQVVHVPTRDEIQPLVNEQRVVELYSK